MNSCLTNPFLKSFLFFSVPCFIFLCYQNSNYLTIELDKGYFSSSVSRNNCDEENVVPKVLILTQARSGSSFLGSIMSSSSSSYYLYEPFKGKKVNGTRLDEIIDDGNEIANIIVKEFLDRLFECQMMTGHVSTINPYTPIIILSSTQSQVKLTLLVRGDTMCRHFFQKAISP